MWQLVSLDLILVCISYLKPKCCMFTSIFSLFIIHKPPLLFFWCPLHECETFKWLYICGTNYMFCVIHSVKLMITLHVAGVYLWLQITDKMKARASLEVIGNNDRILDRGTHQTNGNLWLKHLLIAWNDLEKSYLYPTLSACY